MDPAIQISRRMSSREEELQRFVRFEWMHVLQLQEPDSSQSVDKTA